MFSIAIDGPAGAGKSTIAKEVAKRLEFIYIDTGAMYRAIGFFINKNQIDCSDEKKLLDACNAIEIEIVYEQNEQQVLLNKENVTKFLRTEEVSKFASLVATKQIVREKLVQLQRELAAKKNVVMDGRDIGTFVLPDAQVKIYLTASVKERAKRRYLEQKEKGEVCNLSEIEADILQRDQQDKNREISPLRQAEDAILIDTSSMSIEQAVKIILSIYEKKISLEV